MDLKLRGKKALVTGSSRGIGLGIARRLAEAGCDVMICARGADLLEESADELRQFGTEIIHKVLDLSIRGNSTRAVDLAVSKLGGIDILVNNVGGNRRKPFEETTDDDWDDVMELNFRGPLEATRAAISYMKKGDGGSVLFISSIYGREFGGKDMSIYHVSKSALISLSKSLAVELAEYGIRVNTIAPGSILFEDGSWDKRSKSDPEGIQRFVQEQLPMGRFGEVEEISDAAVFLVSDRASLVTGTCWNVDGGQSRTMI